MTKVRVVLIVDDSAAIPEAVERARSLPVYWGGEAVPAVHMDNKTVERTADGKGWRVEWDVEALEADGMAQVQP